MCGMRTDMEMREPGSSLTGTRMAKQNSDEEVELLLILATLERDRREITLGSGEEERMKSGGGGRRE
jgi:hypothetical protein